MDVIAGRIKVLADLQKVGSEVWNYDFTAALNGTELLSNNSVTVVQYLYDQYYRMIMDS